MQIYKKWMSFGTTYTIILYICTKIVCICYLLVPNEFEVQTADYSLKNNNF